MNRIVVGYNGSEDAHTLRTAAEYAEAFSAELTVVSVGPTLPLPVPVPPEAAVAGAAITPVTMTTPGQEPATDRPLEAAERQLVVAQGLLAGVTVECEFRPETGDPAEQLLSVAEETDADLIVVGSHEHSLLERLLSGKPVDEKLARHSPRDVLLVHRS